MVILCMRTDNPVAELHVFRDTTEVANESWHAHRELSATIHTKIEHVLAKVHQDSASITGIVFFAGGGSFTGLRIGAAVANALALSLQVPIVATTGDDWVSEGVAKLLTGTVRAGVSVEPIYDRPAATTPPKK